MAAQATVLPAVSLQAGRPIQVAPLAPVKRVAIAKRVAIPLVEQPTRFAAIHKLTPGLQSASAKPEDGRPGVRQASIA